jgi:hypothetical protein
MRTKTLFFLSFIFLAGTLFGQTAQMTDAEFKEGFAVLMRLGAVNPFLKDSPDVHLEPQSLNQFFTEKIYNRLEGNSYFGYRFDEGFTACAEKEVSIEEIRDLTETTGAAYRRALEMSLEAAGFKIKPGAACQIGLAIVGVETKETAKTLSGVMIEAYFRNAKKSFFIRFGTGNPRGLAGAIQLSAETLVTELEKYFE